MKIFLLLLLSLYSPFEKVPKFFEENYCGPNIYADPEYNLLCGEAKYFKIYPIKDFNSLIVITSDFYKNSKFFIIDDNFEIRESISETTYFSYDKNYKIYYNKGKIKVIKYFLEYEKGIFAIKEDEEGKIKNLFSFKYEYPGELNYDFFCDGINFVILAQKRKNVSYQCSEEINFIWGNFKKVFSQKVVFPLSYTSSLESYYFDENCPFTCFSKVIFDYRTLSKDFKGYWGAVNYGIGEEEPNMGGILFLPLDGSKIKIFLPLNLISYAFDCLSVLDQGKLIFSLGGWGEGIHYSSEFLNPLFLDINKKKIYNFFKMENDYEYINNIIIKDDKLWLKTGRKLYCFSLQNKKPLAIFTLNKDEIKLLKIEKNLIIERLKSKNPEDFFWALQLAKDFEDLEIGEILKKYFNKYIRFLQKRFQILKK